MKYSIAILLVLAAAVSAQYHKNLGHAGSSHAGHMGSSHVSGGHMSSSHMGSGQWGGHHSRLGRSLVAAPIYGGHVGHLGVVGAHGYYGGLVHHRMGRSILLAQPVAYSTGIVHSGVLNHGLVGSHHGLVGSHHGLLATHHGLLL